MWEQQNYADIISHHRQQQIVVDQLRGERMKNVKAKRNRSVAPPTTRFQNFVSKE